MNSIGQAAVTDALYFLLIVSFLSVFLFGFSNSYGAMVKEQINDQYNVIFATNALKTILYSSTTRNPEHTFDHPDAEIDYLLVILKEDYADDQRIDDTERNVLGKTISSILAPIEDNVDYVFIITTTEEGLKDYVFFYFHVTNFVETPSTIRGNRHIFYSSGDPSHINYFCAVGSDGVGYEYSDIESRLRKLIVNVGPTSEATSTIRLMKITEQGLRSVEAQVNLVMWDAMWLGKTDDSEGLFYLEDGYIPPEWDCVESTLEL